MHGDSDAIIRLAREAYERQDYPAEAALWRQLSEMEPETPEWRHNLALALRNAGQLAEAKALFDTLAIAHPHLSRVHNNRAALLVQMGTPIQELIPAFELALNTSDSYEVFLRHFLNLCRSVALGFDDFQADRFDRLKDVVERAFDSQILHATRDRQVRQLVALGDTFVEVAKYRVAFAEKKWRRAEEHLSQAKRRLSQWGLINQVSWLATTVEPYFDICRGIFVLLERIGDDPSLTPHQAATGAAELASRADALFEESKSGPVHYHLLRAISLFLRRLAHSLKWLAFPGGPYQPQAESRASIGIWTGHSFFEIGHDLVAIDRFVEAVCRRGEERLQVVAGTQHQQRLVSDIWVQIALRCHETALDAHIITSAAARSILGWSGQTTRPIAAELVDFKEFVERQAAKDIYVDASPQENIARALLQSRLTSRSYREVPVRAGRMDLLVFEGDGQKVLIETKIWRGQQYHDQGLREIEEYVAGEDDGSLRDIYYVLFDPTQAFVSSALPDTQSVVGPAGPTPVRLIKISIALVTPSKKGAK